MMINHALWLPACSILRWKEGRKGFLPSLADRLADRCSKKEDRSNEDELLG